jgi:hypothetical protein
MSPTDAGSEPAPSRDLRDRPLGRILLLVVVLAVAFVALKSCASRDTEVESDEAVEIAREQVDYEPDRVMVRFTPRGIDSVPHWAVSLTVTDDAGNLEQVTVVVVDARNGEVVEIDREGG